eukprot:4450136-Pyramimonas_sp.AAC.1
MVAPLSASGMLANVHQIDILGVILRLVHGGLSRAPRALAFIRTRWTRQATGYITSRYNVQAIVLARQGSERAHRCAIGVNWFQRGGVCSGECEREAAALLGRRDCTRADGEARRPRTSAQGAPSGQLAAARKPLASIPRSNHDNMFYRG